MIDNSYKSPKQIPVSNINDINIEDDEVSLEDLQIMINKLTYQTNDGFFPQRIEALNFFADYLSDNNLLPETIFVALHNFILFIIQQPHEAELDEIILSILENIAGFMNEDIDFSFVVQYVWQFIPNENAFDTLAVLAAEQLGAAKCMIIVLPQLFELLNSSDLFDNVLIVISGMTCHYELLTDMAPYLDQFLQIGHSCDTLMDKSLSLYYSIISHYTESEKCLDEISHFSSISLIFENASKSDTIFHSALKLLEKITSKIKNPIAFLEKANAIQFIEKSIKSNNPQIIKDGLKLCLSFVENPQGIAFFIQSGIIEPFFKLLDSSFDISELSMNMLCKILSESPSETVYTFLENDFIDIVLSLIQSYSDSTQMNILKAIQTIVITMESAGDTNGIHNLVESTELMDVLWELSEEKTGPLRHIASYIYEKTNNI